MFGELLAEASRGELLRVASTAMPLTAQDTEAFLLYTEALKYHMIYRVIRLLTRGTAHLQRARLSAAPSGTAGDAKEQSPAVELPNKLGDAEEQSPAVEMPNHAGGAEEQSPALIV